MGYGNFRALSKAAASVEHVPYNRNSLICNKYRKDLIKNGIPETETEKYLNTYTLVQVSAFRGVNRSKNRYPSNTTKQDMFRHGYWSALLVDLIGVTNAEKVTTTYEDETPNNNGLSREMDIFNNKVGRELAIGKIFKSEQQCGDMIVGAINEGKFKKIVDGKLVPSGELDKVVFSTYIAEKAGVRKEPIDSLPDSWGTISNEVIGIMDNNYSNISKFVKISYSAPSSPDANEEGIKIGYILKSLIDKYQPKINNEFYNPYDNGWRNTQRFCDTDNYTIRLRGHTGHDIVSRNIGVRAITGGKVMVASHQGANGYIVQIEHKHNNKSYYSHYSHLRPNSIIVKVGDEVKPGQLLGLMGGSGKSGGNNDYAKHLHLGFYSGIFKKSPIGYFRVNSIKSYPKEQKNYARKDSSGNFFRIIACAKPKPYNKDYYIKKSKLMQRHNIDGKKSIHIDQGYGYTYDIDLQNKYSLRNWENDNLKIETITYNGSTFYNTQKIIEQGLSFIHNKL
jgi:murein DD-endopeptidase MepM/ murein hydrolase activator NlpD